MFICGDIHANFGKLNSFLSKKTPDVLLACGDFGYWPMFDWKKYRKYIQLHGDADLDAAHHYATLNCMDTDKIKSMYTKIYWCDGNHEQHDILDRLKESHPPLTPIEITRNVFYCPRGTIVNINNKNILFVGGAESIDKNSRREYIDWFKQETISYKDFELIMDNINCKIDIVISHTCPEFIARKLVGRELKTKDPSVNALTRLWENIHPTHWFYGHWHQYHREFYRGTTFVGLNMCNQTNWWVKYGQVEKSSEPE